MLKVFKRLNAHEWALISISIALVVAQVITDLRIPGYMSTITRLIETEGSTMNEILRTGGMMLLMAVLSMLVMFCSGFVSSRLSAYFSRDLRNQIFHKVQTFSLEEIDRFSTASLITRSTNDVAQLQNFIAGGFTMIVNMPITVGIALSKMAGGHWQWTVLTTACVIIVLSVVIFVILYAHPRFRRMQVLTDNLNAVTRENMTGIRVIRAYNAAGYQMDKFTERNDTLTKNQTQAQRAMTVMRPTMRFTQNILTIGIYCIGAAIISRSSSTEALTTFSTMVVFSNYAARILFSIQSLNMIFNQIPRVTVCANRINEVLETDVKVKSGTDTENDASKEGTIEFRNVSFRYPDSEEDVIHDISFTANKGETVAFIGATGSGKTSLVNLVPRFYDATGGQVLIDGKDVREYDLKTLHNKIGYTPQRAVLFTGTVYSNVNYGENNNTYNEAEAFEAVKDAVRIAQAKDFVEEKEDGYFTFISRGGTNVSGGQKQRISIARSVFRKPEIYIFDDTFGALDYKTDRTLRAALKEETAGVTTLIVAQRIGTIRDADKILVLDDGEIVGMGTHDELMKTCMIYREIAYTQMSEEELA
ncbi:MAG: ABC transporter ATP-binding protein [Lachnospiraceae bacterium]|nr:ABC transporter ATP-binding protein [Lachnospiraceae bacterium]